MPKQTYEEWKGTLSPEQESARKASDQFADQESMGDNQSKLPENARFSGVAGLLPWMGYTRPPSGEENLDPAFRAIIHNTAGGLSGGEYWRRGDSAPMGAYNLEAGVSKEDEDLMAWNEKLTSIGSTELGPGELVLNQLDPRRLSNWKGNKATEVINHELTHRGTDRTSDMIKDLLSYVKSTDSFDDFEKESIEFAISRGGNEILASQMSELNTDPSAKPGLYVRLVDDAMRKFLTPEKQKEYGVRIPTPAAKPLLKEEEKSWWQH